MPDHVLTTARPATAAIAWATRDALYVEIPCRDGPPYIARYRKTIEGLTAALNILIEHDEPAYRPPTTHPKTTKVATGATSRAPWATDEQRAKTQAILKRMKIT